MSASKQPISAEENKNAATYVLVACCPPITQLWTGQQTIVLVKNAIFKIGPFLTKFESLTLLGK